MKRLIKFRVWDIFYEQYIPEDVYNILSQENESSSFGIMVKDWKNYKEGEYFYSNSQIIEQFAGLKDKNGVDMYEGDKVVSFNTSYEDKPTKNNKIKIIRGCFKLTASGKSDIPVHNYKSSELEVVGNIHENKNNS